MGATKGRSSLKLGHHAPKAPLSHRRNSLLPAMRCVFNCLFIAVMIMVNEDDECTHIFSGIAQLCVLRSVPLPTNTPTDPCCEHVIFTDRCRRADCGTICAPSLMAVLGQYVQWAGKAERRMPRLLCYWLMLVVNSLKCNSWRINLANLGRHAQLTRCRSAVAELLARSSATAEKQRVSCACLPRLAKLAN